MAQLILGSQGGGDSMTESRWLSLTFLPMSFFLKNSRASNMYGMS